MFTSTTVFASSEFAVSLETVLAGHENWVYGVHWQPPTYNGTRSFPRLRPQSFLYFIIYIMYMLNVSVSPCRRRDATASRSALSLHGQNHDRLGSRGGVWGLGGAGQCRGGVHTQYRSKQQSQTPISHFSLLPSFSVSVDSSGSPLVSPPPHIIPLLSPTPRLQE